MKRVFAAAALVLLLLGAGLAWLLRRPAAPAPLDDPGSGFLAEASGPGRLFRFLDGQAPLRLLRWLPPLPGGLLAAQQLGQNDRQRLALFGPGPNPDSLLILKPLGVSEAFWRFAALKAALPAPGGALLLLYQSGDAASAELPLVLDLDTASQQVRWSYRGAGDRLALTPGGEAAYLCGGKAPIQRLALASGGQGGPHPAPKVLELPPEIQEVEGFLPTGATTFLVSHSHGLAAYQPGSGWTHFPAPEAPGVPCQGWTSTLTPAGKAVWWQAAPGSLAKIRPDGRPLATWSEQLEPGDPLARDAQLLRLLGADPAGDLWFTLASPAPAAQAPAAAAPGPAEAGEAAPAGAGPQGADGDWPAYAAAQGLDRIYRWDPAAGKLARVALGPAWTALNPPPSVPAPAPAQALAPAAGALLAEGNRCVWWLPLAALPLAPVRLAD